MLPSKLQHGQPFKESTIRKINEILDYLRSQRLVSDNKTIKINQFTSGVRFISYRQWNNNICNS